MNVTITIENIEEKETEKYHLYDIEKKNVLEYEDAYEASCKLYILSDGVMIDRKAASHHTRLSLRAKSYCQVESAQGTLILNVKLLAIDRQDDIISIAYSVESQEFLLSIKFWESI